uniref:Protein phosphatase 1E n=1 Tax=Phallusia mammillata TaxID=59560 RepID=A0A6F9DPX4_9ASCI|nr:protein phosphatase 1F [Phallusia mammillata]
MAMSSDQWVEKYKDFLQSYCTSHPSPVANDDPLPFRLLFRAFTASDLEGESLDLCLQYLKTVSCPDLLNLAIAQHTTSRVLASDLAFCIKEQQDSEADENHYDGSGVAHHVLATLHNVCLEWNTQLPEHLQCLTPSPQFSDCGIRNTRRKMEDRHNVFNNLNILTGLTSLPTIQFYAVFDGHGGLDAAVYAAKQLHLNLIKLENFQENLTESLKSSIRKTDDDFCSKAKNERLRSGTTAIVAAIYEQVLHLAWVGDSQAVLVRNGIPMDITVPHKPEREDEKLRIEEMGGCVVWFGAWRVNGSLAVSRAIGDADHKPYVSGEADTTTISLDGSEDFLCLACDGFWDVFTGADLVDLVREYLKEPTNERSKLATTLCAKAKSKGSTDNISVVVVFMREEINLPEPPSPKVVENSVEVGEGESQTKTENQSNGNDEKPTNNSPTNNNSNTNNNNSQPGDDRVDGIALVKGHHVEPTQKARVPHKLLVNFVKKLNQKEVEKDLAIVTESSPHSKLPHTLAKPRWPSPNISPNMQRRGTLDSVLSLSTMQSSITELPLVQTKKNRSTSELPQIEVVDPFKTQPSRHSVVNGNPTSPRREKPLGHRAVRKRGVPRVPYAPSLVSCQTTVESSVSPRPLRRSGGYSQSIPGDLHHQTNTMISDRDLAITNSLSIKLKPLKRHGQTTKSTRQRSIVRLVNRGRQRSRSAF